MPGWGLPWNQGARHKPTRLPGLFPSLKEPDPLPEPFPSPSALQRPFSTGHVCVSLCVPHTLGAIREK